MVRKYFVCSRPAIYTAQPISETQILHCATIRVFNKTVEYVNMFSKFSTEDTIGLVRS
jgi:hypothetical protein